MQGKRSYRWVRQAALALICIFEIWLVIDPAKAAAFDIQFAPESSSSRTFASFINIEYFSAEKYRGSRSFPDTTTGIVHLNSNILFNVPNEFSLRFEQIRPALACCECERSQIGVVCYGWLDPGGWIIDGLVRACYPTVGYYRSGLSNVRERNENLKRVPGQASCNEGLSQDDLRPVCGKELLACDFFLLGQNISLCRSNSDLFFNQFGIRAGSLVSLEQQPNLKGRDNQQSASEPRQKGSVVRKSVIGRYWHYMAFGAFCMSIYGLFLWRRYR